MLFSGMEAENAVFEEEVKVETLNDAIKNEVANYSSEEEKPLSMKAFASSPLKPSKVKRRRRSKFETDPEENQDEDNESSPQKEDENQDTEDNVLSQSRPKRKIKMPKKLQETNLLSFETSLDDSITDDKDAPKKSAKKKKNLEHEDWSPEKDEPVKKAKKTPSSKVHKKPRKSYEIDETWDENESLEEDLDDDDKDEDFIPEEEEATSRKRTASGKQQKISPKKQAKTEVTEDLEDLEDLEPPPLAICPDVESGLKVVYFPTLAKTKPDAGETNWTVLEKIEKLESF